MIIKEKSIKTYVGLQRVLNYIFSKHTVANPEQFTYRRFIKGDRIFEQRLKSCGNVLEPTSIVMEQRLQNILDQFCSNDGLVRRPLPKKFFRQR